MSRNKQVDRLREGLNAVNAPREDEDPVTFALKIINDYKDEVFSLAKIILEDREFFKGLHAEMVHQGCSQDLIINRKGSNPISLGELGFNRLHPKFKTKEDRAKLIAINGMVMASMCDQVLSEREASRKELNRSNMDYTLVCDFLHKTLRDLNIWNTHIGSFKDMLTTFVAAFTVESDKSYHLQNSLDSVHRCHVSITAVKQSEIDSLRRMLKRRDDEIDRSCVVIKDLTEDLKYQVVTTKQYKRELDLLRADIINREISGENL